MTEPTTMFEPDWLDLGSTMLTALETPTPYGGDHTQNIVRAVIQAYQRQMAAAGLVVVQREDALTTATYAIHDFKLTYDNGTTPKLVALFASFARVLDAAQNR